MVVLGVGASLMVSRSGVFYLSGSSPDSFYEATSFVIMSVWNCFLRNSFPGSFERIVRGRFQFAFVLFLFAYFCESFWSFWSKE